MQLLYTILLNVFLSSRFCKAFPLSREPSDTKYVLMHHIVGNTYSYTPGDWKDDIEKIAPKGVDALALNIGSDPWQPKQIADAYNAAKDSDLKIFVSYDFTSFPCDISEVIKLQNQYSSHPSQFKYNGKPMISSYGGGCLGSSGWEQIKDQTGGYTMPFISGIEGQFDAWDKALDSWYCWGCAWPQGNQNKTTGDDNYYMNQLGNKFATTVSPWMFTHYDYKNWYQRGDYWLLNTRWDDLINLRDKLTFVEMVSWNDFGESSYFGPIKGEQPQGTTWATDNFDHSEFFAMSEYYIKAFKTGSYPTITEDKIYYWARPHPAAAIATSDPLSTPRDGEYAEDYLWVVVFAKSEGTAIISSGDSHIENSVTTGVNKLKVPLTNRGGIKVSLVRNGKPVIQKTDDRFTYTHSPKLYNYNAFVGSAGPSRGRACAP